MNEKIDFDLKENTCELCAEVWFTYFCPDNDPNYCPYCGVKLTTKNGGRRNGNRN